MEDPADRIMEILCLLGGDEYSGYLYQPIPCALDEPIERLLNDFLAAEDSLRSTVLECLSLRAARGVRCYGIRRACRAVRENRAELLELAAVAVAAVFDCGGEDVREHIIELSLVYHCARKIGVSADTVFHRAGRMLGGTAKQHLASFCARPEEAKQIDVMWWEEFESPDGFLLRPRSQGRRSE